MRIRPEFNNNNTTEEAKKDQVIKRKRGRPRIYPVSPVAASVVANEEIELEGSPVIGDPVEDIKNDDNVLGKVKCPECDTVLRSSWYLSKSRHSCVSDTNEITEEEEEEEEERLPVVKKRKLIDSDPKNKTSRNRTFNSPTVIKSPRAKKESTEAREMKMFCCPLSGCSRKCETKVRLMIHLATSHFLAKLEEKYSEDSQPGETESAARKCPHCQEIQPNNNILVMVKHVATEHADVIEELIAAATRENRNVKEG